VTSAGGWLSFAVEWRLNAMGGLTAMEGVGPAVAVVLVVLAGIGIWMFSMSLDKNRITDYVEQRGGRIISISWAPFGKGWFGEKEERIYEVVYYDKDGNQHFATCKTSLWTGVYWTEDRVAHGKSKWYDSLAPSNEPGRPLIDQIPKEEETNKEEELRHLREENARLREQLGRQPSSEAIHSATKCPACGSAISANAVRCPDCQIALR
jgi:hypothetical protein